MGFKYPVSFLDDTRRKVERVILVYKITNKYLACMTI